MLHYFNPGHETAVLNASRYYMSPANVATMRHELAFLPAWQAGADDFVLLDGDLPEDFLAEISLLGTVLPRGISQNALAAHAGELANQAVCLWGITPQAIHVFDTINEAYRLNLTIPPWHEAYKELNSRQLAKQCLEFIISRTNSITGDVLPQFFRSLDSIEEYINRNCDLKLLAKAPYSSSGRGLLWLPQGGLTRTERQILHGYLKKQDAVSIEKVLDKRLDFAVEFLCRNKHVACEGLSLFYTSEKGAYQGNFIGNQHDIEEQIGSFISLSLLDEVKALLLRFIEEHIAPLYEGYIGVDMLIYAQNGKFELQPCVEINLRNNMGVMALKISQNILAEHSTGRFRIDFNAQNGQIYCRHQELKKLHPPIMENQKLTSGYLPLCPVTESSRYHAYVMVG
jgi:hypothetical protein